MALSLAKLEKFVRTRNKSGFASNLQFAFDADACGFKVEDLGDAKKTDDGIYYWETPFGMLVECGGSLMLSDVPYEKDYVIRQAIRRASGRAFD